MFRASATGTPKLVGMYARVGSSSPVQDPAEAEDDESAGSEDNSLGRLLTLADGVFAVG